VSLKAGQMIRKQLYETAGLVFSRFIHVQVKITKQET
jgi:hypothetical protein